jgi:hypothetical protein
MKNICSYFGPSRSRRTLPWRTISCRPAHDFCHWCDPISYAPSKVDVGGLRSIQSGFCLHYALAVIPRRSGIVAGAALEYFVSQTTPWRARWMKSPRNAGAYCCHRSWPGLAANNPDGTLFRDTRAMGGWSQRLARDYNSLHSWKSARCALIANFAAADIRRA